MITIHQLPEADPPKALLRFNYVAPTHDVCKLLEQHGMTDRFHTVKVEYVATNEDLSNYDVGHLLNLASEKLLEVLGPYMYNEQQRPLDGPDISTRVEMEAP